MVTRYTSIQEVSHFVLGWRTVSLEGLKRRISVRGMVTTSLLIGFLTSSTGIVLEDNPVLRWAITLMLGVGLLASTYGVDHAEMRREDWKLLLLVLTVGVIVKAVIIFVVMYVLFRELRFLIISMTVAQMDPLSVSALLDPEKSKLSTRAANLVRLWAALDDPVTVAMTLFLLVVGRALHIDTGIPFEAVAVNSLWSLGEYGVANYAFMATVLWTYQIAYKQRTASAKITFTLVFLAGGLIVGATAYWMFGLALIGLYLRPAEDRVAQIVGRVLDVSTTVAFIAAGLVTGMVVYQYGVDLKYGVPLGIAAFASQTIVTFILIRRARYEPRDRARIATVHQNGFTATVLGLQIGAIPIVMPAIIVTHIMHFVSTTLLDRHYRKVDATA